MILNKLSCRVIANDCFPWFALSHLLQQLVNDLTLSGSGIAKQKQSFVFFCTRHPEHVGASIKPNESSQRGILFASVNINLNPATIVPSVFSCVVFWRKVARSSDCFPFEITLLCEHIERRESDCS